MFYQQKTNQLLKHLADPLENILNTSNPVDVFYNPGRLIVRQAGLALGLVGVDAVLDHLGIGVIRPSLDRRAF